MVSTPGEAEPALDVLSVLSVPSTRPGEQSPSLMARSGGLLLPRTYVSPLDRQSPLVCVPCPQRRRLPHTDTLTVGQQVQFPHGELEGTHNI